MQRRKFLKIGGAILATSIITVMSSAALDVRVAEVANLVQVRNSLNGVLEPAARDAYGGMQHIKSLSFVVGGVVGAVGIVVLSAALGAYNRKLLIRANSQDDLYRLRQAISYEFPQYQRQQATDRD